MIFKDLPEEWGLQHTYVSPTYAQSNDKAGAALKKVKKLLKKSEVESHGSMNVGFCGKEMLARNTSPFLCEEERIFSRVFARKTWRCHDTLK